MYTSITDLGPKRPHLQWCWGPPERGHVYYHYGLGPQERTSQAKHDFQLNTAMNMRCRSPEQHRRKGTTNSHTGNSTSLCTTSSPSLSSVCRRGGEGEGALWFPVLWCCGLSFPTPPLWFPVLWFHVLPLPPRWPRSEA